MSRRQKYTEHDPVQNGSSMTNEQQAAVGASRGKKKRTRHKQTVKNRNRKLSVAVICSNPYLRQFL